MADIAYEGGQSFGGRFRRRRASIIALNPAKGTIELTPEGQLAAEKAILREVRRMKIVFYRKRANFQMQQLYLKFALRLLGARRALADLIANQFNF